MRCSLQPFSKLQARTGPQSGTRLDKKKKHPPLDDVDVVKKKEIAEVMTNFLAYFCMVVGKSLVNGERGLGSEGFVLPLYSILTGWAKGPVHPNSDYRRCG